MFRFTLCLFSCLFQHITDEDFNYEYDLTEKKKKIKEGERKKSKKLKTVM